ncbi:hypothetical protein W97_00452 [Coniosporium apollinis CBS 100218]|uniref:Queuosine 5'-phosphate N-glycosylase/hydrolase n=1 Tax=Coniosporium apollinis (strain CBS 100218) TaxID=1168221 RepID=R7YHG4_CONA1|nr:uncharacterized protein W97_00452 [Coniosporium apollinis CBS 100218]EON61239.1 hypothetical protein W97_00452 [Coniosporium apollinis CBS 100218]
MADDEADPELVALLRQHLGLDAPSKDAPADTGVLQSAEYVYNNSIDVAIDMRGTKAAAELIYRQMQQRSYSTSTWSEHELHPQAKDESTVNFIFTMDLLNFCFWSEKGPAERFAVKYRGQWWTGYWSLVAVLQRALDEEIPITSPDFWQNEDACTEEVLRHVFRSATAEEIPLFQERVACLREAGRVLCESFGGSVVDLVSEVNSSAASLVNLLAEHFPCFRDEVEVERRNVRFLKRAQIFVADLWAAFDGESYGSFHDIDQITMFADYRIPQILHTLGCLSHSPPLAGRIQRQEEIQSGHSWETQLRGCSIWCVELIRREILRQYPQAHLNAILIDFFLYDTMKELEKAGKEQIPHHRTRSIWY